MPTRRRKHNLEDTVFGVATFSRWVISARDGVAFKMQILKLFNGEARQSGVRDVISNDIQPLEFHFLPICGRPASVTSPRNENGSKVLQFRKVLYIQC
jgi:hypothetical protein